MSNKNQVSQTTAAQTPSKQRPTTAQSSYFERDRVGTIRGRVQLVADTITVEIINFALNAYGYLIDRNEKLTAGEFAARIRSSYDCIGNPQNKAVVDALVCLI